MIRLACPLCEDPGPWASAQERMAHIRAHHTVTCEVCDRPVNASGIDAHMRYMHADEPADPAPAPAVDLVDDNPPDDQLLDQPAAEPQVTPVDDPDESADLRCGQCDAGPFADRRGLAAHRRSHETVTCEVCDKAVKANGLGPHMTSHRRAADAGDPPAPVADSPDAAAQADPEPAAPGPAHVQDPDPVPSAPPAPAGATCEVEGCDRPAAKHSAMCSGHRGRFYRLGDVQADVPLRSRKSYPAPVPAPAEPAAQDPAPAPAPPRIDRNALVTCPECDEPIRAGGLGNHRAGHRRAAERTVASSPPAPAGRPLRDVVAELLPGAADELLDRLTAFVAKHEPDGGHGRWVVATAENGPWLCRTAGISLLVAREHVPCIVVALDDIYAHTGRPPAETDVGALRPWPAHRKAAAS